MKNKEDDAGSDTPESVPGVPCLPLSPHSPPAEPLPLSAQFQLCKGQAVVGLEVTEGTALSPRNAATLAE